MAQHTHFGYVEEWPRGRGRSGSPLSGDHRHYHLGMRIEPFVVEVSDAVLEDLRERIRRTRWPDPAPGGPWAQGTDLEYLRDLLAYWADGFDWRRQERWLNRFDHRVAEVDGVRIHFVHHRAGDGGVPLVLTQCRSDKAVWACQ